jgi:peptidoglycan/xylan/chitin deacetylase (PgdA/CDA1 family)
MKNRSLLLCVALTLVTLTGCNKVKKVMHLNSAETTVVVEGEPSPGPSTSGTGASVAKAEPSVAAAVPAPTPAAVSNKTAAVIVLCYHRFEDLPKDALAIKPSEFEAQMQALKDNGFGVISMQDFLAWRRGEKEIPAKSALITIDDGYVSGYDVAWPILKKFGYPFTMFVYLQYVGSGGKSISWAQLNEMRDEGVDIQCHSWTHQNLHGKGAGFNKIAAEEIKKMGYEAWLQKEIGDSKEQLEKQLGLRISAFAYPYGVYNQKARDAVKAADYEAAFTVYGQRIGFSGPFDLIGRYAISSKEPQIFENAIRMVGGGQIASASSGPVVAQVAAASMATQPMQGETISNPKPLIKANLATMGAIDAGTVTMRISGFGLVPATYDEATKMVSYQPGVQSLRDKNYTVIISAKVGGKRVETSWSFNFDPAAATAPAAQ